MSVDNEIVRTALRRSKYVLTEFPLAILRFVILLPMLVFSIGTMVIGFGFVALMFTLRVAGWFAGVDRIRLSRVQEWTAERPAYRTDQGGYSGVRKVTATIWDAARWRDVAHALAGLPIAIPAFVLIIAWWGIMLSGLTSFLYAWALPNGGESVASLLGLGDGWMAEAALNTAIGMVFLLTLPAMARVMTGLIAGPTRMLLTTEGVTELRERVSDLAESRDAAVSAEADALRRLERDIHDGPQQRLVRLAMDLSTAQRRMETDPDAAKPLLEEAITQTRETLDELRALSRGIAPPILADRGLPAALAALAGRSPTPVELDVDLPTGTRLPQQVENAAYFVVAETLTNVAKHAAASQCRVHLGREGTLVRVMVSDDGLGGAHTAKGHGLAGLADRLRAIGGRLDVESPAGGPTIVTAEIRCGS